MVKLDVRDKIRSGSSLLAKAVGCTLGPQGSNVLIDGYRGLITTKDGVTVAAEVHSDDPVEQMVIDSMKGAALRTNSIAGDGTTTSVILADAFLQRGLDLVEKGESPMEVRKSLEHYVNVAKLWLSGLSLKIDLKEDEKDSLISVASMAANNDSQIGQTIVEAFLNVGKSGVVQVRKSGGTKTHIEYTEGFRLDKGFHESAMYMNIAEKSLVFEEPLIYVCNGRIATMQENLTNLLNYAHANKKSVVIFAKEVDKNILLALDMNKSRGIADSMVVYPPGYGEAQAAAFKDIAVFCGANVKLPGETISVTDLGTAKKITIKSDQTVIEEGAGEQNLTVESIGEKSIEATYREGEFDQRKERVSTKLATIFVGGTSDMEVEESIARYEDGMCALKCAVEEGILPGGGNALKCVDEFANSPGEFKGCLSQISNILSKNDSFGQKIKKFKLNEGLNRLTGKRVSDLMKSGVVDTVKGLTTAVESAGSIAGMLLLTEVCIYQERTNKVM